VTAKAGDARGDAPPRGVRIRPLTPDDFMALCRYDWSPLVSERDTVYLFITQDHARYCFAAEDERGKAIGYLVAAGSTGGDAVFVLHVHMRSKYRRRGVGGALVRALEEAARSGRVEVIWFLARDSATGFYSHLGYGPLDDLLHPEAQRYVRDWKRAGVMGKRLEANDAEPGPSPTQRVGPKSGATAPGGEAGL